MSKGYDNYIKNKEEKEIESQFEQIRTYLGKNGPTNSVTLAEKIGINIAVVQRFILDISNTEYVSKIIVEKCKKCGVMIKDGRYCNNCSSSIANEVRNLFDEDKTRNCRPISRPSKEETDNKGDKMHYLQQ